MHGLGTPKVILLTSAGAPALRGRRAKLFAATLAKPVKQSDLLDAIVTAFTTPAASRRSRAKEPRRPTQAVKTRLRVLVAEDNPTNQKLVSAMLDQKGHQVTVVGNGRLAVERVAHEAFDLILMDVQMPEMSGLEATAAIRRREEGSGRHLPIVALTARAMAGDREQCLAAGMDAYVSKPVRAPELFSAIDALVAGQVIRATDIDAFGSTETNDAEINESLPLYTSVALNGPAAVVCGSAELGIFNKVGNRRFLRFSVPAARTITVRVASIGLDAPIPDPDFVLFGDGPPQVAEEAASTVEQASFPVEGGDYVVEVYEYSHIDPSATDNVSRGDTCMNVTITG